jgi:catechol-2,3-dioxygenase
MKINELTIFTTQLDAQSDFYSKELGLPILESSDTFFSIAIGYSVLVFEQHYRSVPYHIAFNIPSNQDAEALAWLRKRIPLLGANGKEMVDFVSWNARSIYFYDAGHNIIELISRKSLSIDSIDTFDHHAFLGISEVGMAVSDIETTYRSLQQLSDFEIFDGNFDSFCAVGDENGLFILVNKDRKDWFPVGDKAFSADFLIKFKDQGKLIEFAFRDGAIEIGSPIIKG